MLYEEGNIESLRETSMCEKFSVASKWDDIAPIQPARIAWLLGSEKSVNLEDFLINERLGYPMSLLYALQSLPERRFGKGHLPLEDLTTIDIHVVTSIPFLDSLP